MQGVRGLGHLRAREAAIQVQGVRGRGHLRAREAAKRVQGVRGSEHLRAREAAIRVQGVRGRELLRAREAAKPVQGVRGREHLRAREAPIPVQGVPRGSRRGGSRAPPPPSIPRSWSSSRTWRTRVRMTSARSVHRARRVPREARKAASLYSHTSRLLSPLVRSRLPVRFAQNSALPGYLGNGMTSLMFSTPVTYCTSLSNPRPNPACGTEPYLLRSRYHQ